MFKIGERVKWVVGQHSIVCRGLIYDSDKENSIVICTENGGRPWRAKLTLKTNILEYDS